MSPTPDLMSFRYTRAVILATLVILVGVGGCDGDTTDSESSESDLRSAPLEVTACRTFDLTATYNSSTYTRVDDSETPSPAPIITIPTSLSSTNPHPLIPVVLTVGLNSPDNAKLFCTYTCPSNASGCTSSTLALHANGCSFGTTYPGSYIGGGGFDVLARQLTLSHRINTKTSTHPIASATASGVAPARPDHVSGIKWTS